MSTPASKEEIAAPSAARPASDLIGDLIPEDQYAAMLGLTKRTCQRHRQLRCAPPYIRIGRRIFYRPAAVRAWLEKSELTPSLVPDGLKSRRRR